MRRRRRENGSDEAEVPLSPLIDCVFLMLIFFLVTSMIKRWERQIPTRMQQDATIVESGETIEELEIGVDANGLLYTVSGRFGRGMNSKAVGDAKTYLAKLVGEVDKSTPVTLIAEEQTEFQTFVRVLDEFEIQGFKKVRARSSDIRFEGGGGPRTEKKPAKEGG